MIENYSKKTNGIRILKNSLYHSQFYKEHMLYDYSIKRLKTKSVIEIIIKNRIHPIFNIDYGKLPNLMKKL